MRQNLMTNPTCQVNTTAWTQVNQGAGTTTGTVVSTDGLGGVFSTYFRQTWTAVSTGAIASTGIIVGSPTGNYVGVAGGQPFVISGYARSSHVGRTAALIATFYDSTNTLVGGTAVGATVDVSLGGWERLSIVGTAPAGATHAYVRLYAQGGTIWALNDTFDLGGVLSEAGVTQALDYFDGGTINCQWDGVAGASTSTWLSLASSRIRLNYCLNPVAASSVSGYSGTAGTGGTVTVAAGAPISGCPDATTAFKATWTVAPTAGTCGGYYYASVGHAGSVGGAWRASGWATFSWDCFVYCALYAYNAAGTNIGTHIMPTMTVTANTPTRFVADDYTPPAATDRLLLLVYRTSGGLPVVGDTFLLTAVTIEPSVPVAGISAPSGVFDPGFFSGDSLNSEWTGAANNSVSTALAVSSRSNFPDLEVETWTGVNPTLTGVPASSGRLLTDRTRAFKIGRGRQYELAQDEAASGSLKVNNSDGSVTGGSYGCTPITSCRVRATWAGVTYPVWTGLVRSWPRVDDNPSTAWSEVELTDAFEPLANREFGTVIEEEIRHMAVPDAWYPMNEPESSTSIGSLVPGGPPAPLVSLKQGGIPLTLGTESVFAGTSETVLSLANATGTTGRASQFQIVGPQNPGSGYSMPFGQPWGVGVFVRMTAGASMVWSALDTDGTVMAGVEVNANTQTITGYQRMGGPGASYVTMPCGTGAMLLGCYLHFGHDGTNAFLYIYGVTSAGTLYAVASSGAEPITTGTSKWVAWGPSFRSDTIWYSSNADLQMCHGTIWTSSPPTPYTNPVISIATAGLNSFLGYKGRDQAAFLAAWAGATVTGDPTDGATLGQVRDTNGSSALDAIRAVAVDQLSRVFMSKDGQLSWQSVHHAMGQPHEWVLGGAAGELPYTGSPGFDFDPTYVYNDVQVQRPDNRGVAQQTSATKALARATDAASGLSYFQRVLQVDSNVQGDADAAALASYLVHEYAQPKTRVRTVSFDPSANPALWPFVLSAELGDTVTLNHRALGRPDLSLSLSIQSINHTVDAQSGSWVTDMELAPWSSDWVLAAMHTTISTATAVGATTVFLAPLPDAAYNPAEVSLAAGTTITLAPGTAYEETMTIASVVSQPTAGATGYTSIAVTLTAAAAHTHSVGQVVCDPLPAGVTDPTKWDAFSVLDSTTVLSI